MTETFLTNYHNGLWTVTIANTFFRWFPADWTLPERKQREKFQAVLHNLPEDISLDTLSINGKPSQFLQDADFKSFKIIKTIDGKRKLVGYYESWDKLQARIHTPNPGMTAF